MSASVFESHYLRPSFSVVAFFITGILPVSSIVLHCTGLITISDCLKFLILPAGLLATVCFLKQSDKCYLVVKGWVAGIVAVAVYDVTRIPFIAAGWNDFIPHIGSWLNASDENAGAIGYLWRYVGNGGGLGIAFFLIADHLHIRKNVVGSGVTFGLIIFTGLVGMLLVVPKAQQLMFEVTPVAFFGGLTGHVAYGLVLGRIYLSLVIRKSQQNVSEVKMPVTA